MLGNAMVMTIFCVLLVSQMLGCAGSGSASEEIDPVELFGYLFAGEPDRTVVLPDPEDQNRELIWELRNIIRIQSFITKSCTKGHEPKCHHLALGYVEYGLDGSVEVALSTPTRVLAGMRGAMEEFDEKAVPCVIQYKHEDKSYQVESQNCDDNDARLLAELLDAWARPPYTVDIDNASLLCRAIITAATVCLENPDAECLEGLPPLLGHVDKIPSPCQQAGDMRIQLLALQSSAEDSIESCGSSVIPVQCGAKVFIKFDTQEGQNRFSWHPNCTLNSDYSGPELVFRLINPDDGHLLVNFVSDEQPGPDLDIFVYKNGCDPDNCIGGGQDTVWHEAETGEDYFIIVDGYEGDSGEFMLEVDCSSGDWTDWVPFFFLNEGSWCLFDFQCNDGLVCRPTGEYSFKRNLVDIFGSFAGADPTYDYSMPTCQERGRAGALCEIDDREDDCWPGYLCMASTTFEWGDPASHGRCTLIHEQGQSEPHNLCYSIESKVEDCRLAAHRFSQDKLAELIAGCLVNDNWEHAHELTELQCDELERRIEAGVEYEDGRFALYFELPLEAHCWWNAQCADGRVCRPAQPRVWTVEEDLYCMEIGQAGELCDSFLDCGGELRCSGSQWYGPIREFYGRCEAKPSPDEARQDCLMICQDIRNKLAHCGLDMPPDPFSRCLEAEHHLDYNSRYFLGCHNEKVMRGVRDGDWSGLFW